MTEHELIESSLEKIEALRADILASETHAGIEAIDPGYQKSARNLLHYLAIRRSDIRGLQTDLGRLGLSSLGRLEAHAQATIDAVTAVLHRLAGRESPISLEETFAEYDAGNELLSRHTIGLLGPEPENRRVRIMVTMPSTAATDPDFIRDMLTDGMNLMRINCAHDEPDAWQGMIDHLRKGEADTGKKALVAFDLAGPKLRTGSIEPGPPVVRWKPIRDEYGRVTQPAFVTFGHSQDIDEGTIFIPTCGELAELATPGDTVLLTDTRDRERILTVADTDNDVCTCACDQTGYVAPGIELKLMRDGNEIARDLVAPLPNRQRVIPLSVGDQLMITSDEVPGKPAVLNDDEEVLAPAQIGCTLKDLFASVKEGERIFLDDGKFAGKITTTYSDRFLVEITRVSGGTAKLKGEKGINIPDTKLELSALTDKDRQDVAFAAERADIISLSFVHRPEDVDELINRLKELGATNVGIVLKIESGQAIENFPEILLSVMRWPKAGIMVARGDLGVEISFERMAEIQEEILWLCEAAHVPVIWATQVLESLAKRGVPSRAEVTDAAASGRAECVMLNKGPHIVDALRFLCDVLPRMASHQTKKSALMRRLNLAHRLDPEPEPEPQPQAQT